MPTQALGTPTGHCTAARLLAVTALVLVLLNSATWGWKTMMKGVVMRRFSIAFVLFGVLGVVGTAAAARSGWSSMHTVLRYSAVSPRALAALGPRTAARGRAAPAPRRRAGIHFRTVDVPGATASNVNGVNDSGVLLGTYNKSPKVFFGFIKSRHGLIKFNYPGTSGVTGSAGINDSGTAVGIYLDKKGAYHGWVRSAAGEFRAINDPLAADVKGDGTVPSAINDAGVIVGEYYGANGVSHGFVYRDGKFITVNAPGAGTRSGQGTSLNGINNAGVLTGNYVDSSNVNHGFVDSSGSFFRFDAPRAGAKAGQGTIPVGISAAGLIVGFNLTKTNALYGWLLAGWRFTPVNDPHAGEGADQGTEVLNISQGGKTICGTFYNAKGDQQGFVATR